jgi:uncharacterized membrane protein YqjE
VPPPGTLALLNLILHGLVVLALAVADPPYAWLAALAGLAVNGAVWWRAK